MTGKIISFWEYCKLNFHKVLDGTRAECRLGKIEKPETEEYVINGVRYVVSTRFSKTENKTMKQSPTKILTAHAAGTCGLVTLLLFLKSYLFYSHVNLAGFHPLFAILTAAIFLFLCRC